MNSASKPMLRILPGIVVCASFALQASPAGEPADLIDEIVVVAHKAERSLRNVAANVTVLTERDLEPRLAASMADALRYTPGIDVEGAGTRFGTEGINIRGIGGNRVALLVDGAPVSDQFSVGRFSNATRDLIDTGFLARAEILHGPASALYGSDAIGGVIALQSADPRNLAGRKGSGGELRGIWHGADRGRHLTALHAISAGRSGALAGVSIRNGHETDSAASAESLDTRNVERRAAMLKFTGERANGDTVSFAWYRHESDVKSTLGSVLGTGRFRTTSALTGDDSSQFDLAVLEYVLTDGIAWLDQAMLRAYYGSNAVEQLTRDERALAARPVSIQRRFVFDQAVRGLEVNLHRQLDTGTATHDIGIGLEYRERETIELRNALETGLDDGVQSNVLLGEVFPLRDFPRSVSRDVGMFVEDAISLADFTVIAGVRADRYELRPDHDTLFADRFPFATPVAVSAGEVSPKLGLVYRPTSSLDLFVQYAHGFRAPPYEDANIGLELPLFNVRAIPNPDLASERSDGVEIGLRWRSARANAHVSAFHTRFEDFIESKARIGVDPESGRVLFQSRNLNEAVIEGIEAGAATSIEFDSGTLHFNASLYRARGENRDNGRALDSVGPAQAVLGAGWTAAGKTWDAELLATFTDGWSAGDRGAAGLFEPPGHAVFDIYLSARVGQRARLRAGVTNLADRVYWRWSDVRGLSPDDPALPYLARPGTSLVLGLDLDW